MRHHTFSGSLALFKELHGRIDSVIDVGVQNLTAPLIEIFPEIKHYLFEPVRMYLDKIEENYSDIDHEVILKAVSSKPGMLYQHLISQDGTGKITHSHLRDTEELIPGFENFYLEIIPTEVTTLDEYFKNIDLGANFNSIIKIDIDGLESEVMKGAEDVAKKCGLIVVECAVGSLGERILLAEKFGYRVWDIVSPGYYKNQLSQVDVFFINRRLENANINFSPWRQTKGKIEWNEWVHLP